jgi:hypothetical protein
VAPPSGPLWPSRTRSSADPARPVHAVDRSGPESRAAAASRPGHTGGAGRPRGWRRLRGGAGRGPSRSEPAHRPARSPARGTRVGRARALRGSAAPPPGPCPRRRAAQVGLSGTRRRLCQPVPDWSCAWSAPLAAPEVGLVRASDVCFRRCRTACLGGAVYPTETGLCLLTETFISIRKRHKESRAEARHQESEKDAEFYLFASIDLSAFSGIVECSTISFLMIFTLVQESVPG